MTWNPYSYKLGYNGTSNMLSWPTLPYKPPRLAGLKAGRRTVAANGSTYEDGFQSGQLKFGFMTINDYYSTLQTLGLLDKASNAITICLPDNHNRVYWPHNAIIVKPDQPDEANFERGQYLELTFNLQRVVKLTGATPPPPPPPPNDPPTVSHIADQTTRVGQSITISYTASDTDGGPLTSQVNSSNTSVATVSLVGEDIVVQGVGVGTATITLIVSDSQGAETVRTFTVTVEPALVSILTEALVQASKTGGIISYDSSGPPDINPDAIPSNNYAVVWTFSAPVNTVTLTFGGTGAPFNADYMPSQTPAAFDSQYKATDWQYFTSGGHTPGSSVTYTLPPNRNRLAVFMRRTTATIASIVINA